MKIERQTKILQLINHYDIETQEDLASRLIEEGFIVTQATISRDIRELRLTKIATSDGKQKYVVLKNKETKLNEKFIRVFKDGFSSMDRAGNIIVLKTLVGMAMAVAAAIDALNFDDIVGCIAGDDTIFCAVRTENDAIRIMEKMNKLVNNNL
ncbi:MULTISPECIES: arginine repressor [Vallitalea]|uniref:Arginine repressor n=2 Tax=Vallitalea TaxID=1348611 RepID=A0A8J8SDT8_9FIRM|nr:arginine repressor [Vallitalea guaymasensis]QUH31059.1 arginine repressor [Vallitalea guaymasensis]GMQ64110.1 arginine repressor [Vallitalea sp. AN17-2]